MKRLGAIIILTATGLAAPLAIGSCLAATAAPSLPAPTLPASPLPTAALPTSEDLATRMTIQVMVNGQGPFPFVIDTGADRSVISRALANQLKLPAGRPVRLHATSGVSDVSTVQMDSLRFGDREVTGVQAAVLEGGNLGAMGMLGIDAVRDQQVTMDFRAHRFSVIASGTSGQTEPPGTIIVYGRRRFGQLVLVDAEADGEKIFVILDTGAQNSVGNAALRRLLGQVRDAHAKHDDVISVTGGQTQADLNSIDQINLGGIQLSGVPIAYADLETFRQFGLGDRPAMLLGMDILHLFRQVSVDFMRRQAAFVPE